MGRKREEVGIMKILDSDIFIDHLRGVEVAEEFFRNNLRDISFSAISEGELFSGRECDDRNKREDLAHFLAQFNKITVDNPVVQFAGDLRRQYSNLALPDAIIAASAMFLDVPLCTRNIKHYERIKGLKVEKPY